MIQKIKKLKMSEFFLSFIHFKLHQNKQQLVLYELKQVTRFEKNKEDLFYFLDNQRYHVTFSHNCLQVLDPLHSSLIRYEGLL